VANAHPFSKHRNDPGASSRINPIQVDVNLTKPVNGDGNIGGDNAEADMSRTGTERHLPSNEPVSTNGKDLAVGSADNGQPQRIRKGRGFTQKYGYPATMEGEMIDGTISIGKFEIRLFIKL
jgi:peptidyl-prolyl isomerase G (cyclophilin G)